MQDLLANLPQFLTELDATISRIIRGIPPRWDARAGAGHRRYSRSTLSEIFGFLRGAAVPYLKGGVEFLIEGVSVLVMAVYFARNPGHLPRRHGRADAAARIGSWPRILDDLGTTLRAWVVGQITAMVLLAALTTLGLWVLGVPYFLAFGVFAGVAAIVPFFGTLLSTVIPALIALGVFGLAKALAVAGVGVGVHLIEANFVAPVVMERQVESSTRARLSPASSSSGKLFGLAGLVVAVPILAVIMVLVRHMLIGELYGDPVSETESSGHNRRTRRAPIAVSTPNPQANDTATFSDRRRRRLRPDDVEEQDPTEPSNRA